MDRSTDMKRLTTAIVLLLSIMCVAAEPCTDTDKPLCDLMSDRIPAFCGDPCLAKFCKRSCRQCPLTCYDCGEVSDITNCSTVITCTDPSDYCFAAQTFTSHFTEAYKLGCGNRQTCLQYSAHSHNRASLEAGCCNSDQCNNKPPSILKIEPEQNLTGNIFPTANPYVCVNKDDDVCTALALHLVNPCAEDCISRLCPHMCRKCFYCLECHEVDHPDNCTETSVCGDEKECYGIEKLSPQFTQVVQLGCMEKKLCQQLELPAAHIFGKRNFDLRGGCCIGDRCNAHPIETITQSTSNSPSVPQTTTATLDRCTSLRYQHQCPHGFTRYPTHNGTHHDCYLLGWQKLTQHDSEAFCKDHCAELVYFETLDELRSLDSYILHSTENPIQVYTDMKNNRNGVWLWSHDHSHVSHSLLSSLINSHRHNCVIVTYEHHTVQWSQPRISMQTTDCHSRHHPFCKMTLGRK